MAESAPAASPASRTEAGVSAAGSEPDWLAERRERAARLAGELELPTQQSKGWEFTDLSGLDLDAFEPAEPGIESEAGALAVPAGAASLGEVDGDGSLVTTLSRGATEREELVRARLGSLVSAEDPFVARNEATWHHGALIHVPAGQRLQAPVAISAIAPGGGRALPWRTLIVLEEGAEAEVWEQYVSADAGPGLANAVTEIVVGPGASLRYVCGQALSRESWIFATQRAEVERDGSLDWVALGFGSTRGKVRMETRLAGRGANARVTGAYTGADSQHLDFDTTQEHAAEHTTSDLSFRGLLDERATAVWRGMIRVDAGAQQTDAFQDCRNLLLANTAHADAIPGLEIEADDVRCTHAAAVAQLDTDQLFYLRSHGLDEALAKRLVVEGFLHALVERLPEGAIAEAVNGALDRRLAELLGALEPA